VKKKPIPAPTLIGQPKILLISVNTPRPAQAQINRHYQLWVPKDAGGDDDILIRRQKADGSADSFGARVDEIVPTFLGVLQIRIKMFADRIVKEMLAELKQEAERALGTPRRA
jgi:hypothetical protein